MLSSAELWLKMEKGFSNNFPICLGAIDGEHIVIQCPADVGSKYHNYKRTFSIVLLAVVVSEYNFVFADIGSQGRISDGDVFRNTVLWQKLCTNQLNLPQAHPFPRSEEDIPYVFLGDGAFALSTPVMKSYSVITVRGRESAYLIRNFHLLE